MGGLRERVAAVLQRFFNWLDRLLGRDAGRSRKYPRPGRRILCDDCKYDYGEVCTRPERPNATECADFKNRRGGG